MDQSVSAQQNTSDINSTIIKKSDLKPANLNAINGAIQQVNKLIGMAGGEANPVKKEDDKKV